MDWPNSFLQLAKEMMLRWPEPMSTDLDIIVLCKSEAAFIHVAPTANYLCDSFFLLVFRSSFTPQTNMAPLGLLSIYLLRCDQDLSFSSTSLATSGVFQPVQFYLCEHGFFLIRPKATKWVLYSSWSTKRCVQTHPQLLIRQNVLQYYKGKKQTQRP